MLIGFIIGIIVCNGIAYAAITEYRASISNLRFVFNDVEKKGSDKPYMYKNGSKYVPLALNYSGTTYVPLRYVCDSLEQKLKVFGKQGKVFIGKIPDGDFMSSLINAYLIDKADVVTNINIKIKDKNYDTGYRITCKDKLAKVSFLLSKRYTQITGIIGLDATSKWDSKLTIYGDGIAIQTKTFFRIDQPQELKIDVTGLTTIRFEIEDEYGRGVVVDLADLMIK